ncbi:MAG: Ig-like domain-containing protein [Prevotellaceae bacterium]|jgi:hypothetical protein|nr:Ig-like domain-containing protein [Prevotellaceae bacterium]
MKRIYLLACLLFVMANIATAQLVTVLNEQFLDNSVSANSGVAGSTIVGDAGVWSVSASASSPATSYWQWAHPIGGAPQGHGSTINIVMCPSSPNGAVDSWLFSPNIQMQSGTEYTLTFGARKYDRNSLASVTIEAWIGANTADLSTGTISSVNTLTSAWTQTSISFTPTTSGAYHIGFHCNSPALTASGTIYAMLDDIIIEAELAGGNAGVTAITLPVSGTNLGNEKVSIEIKNFGDTELSNIPVGFRVGNETPVSAVYTGTLAPEATDIFEFPQTADLSAAGTHIIKAWTELAGDVLVSNDSATKTVTNTLCDIISAFAWQEGFDLSAEDLPECWFRYKALFNSPTVSTADFVSVNGGWALTQTNSGLQANHIRINNYGTNVSEWLVTPPISLPSGNNLQLTFDLALTDYYGTNSPAQTNGADDKFIVVVSTDGGNTWNMDNATMWDNTGNANVYNNIATTGEEVSIDLTQYSGNIKIAFYAESTISNADNFIHIDNVKIANIPACIKPVQPAVNNITPGTANIVWTAGKDETEWNVVVSATALSDPATGTVHHVATNSYPASGLEPARVYYVYIQADCGNGDVSEWISFYFVTTQIPASLTYEPSFETNDNWTFTNSEDIPNKWFIGSTSSTSTYPVENGLYISGDNGNSNEYITSTPATVYAYRTLNFDHQGTVRVSFKWRCLANDGTFDFMRAFLVPEQVLLKAGDHSRMTGLPPEGWIDLMDGELGNEQETYKSVEKEIAFSEAKNMNLVFYWTNDGITGSNPPASVTNLKVEYADCITPVDVLVNDVTHQTATLNWTANAENKWNVVVSETELDDPSTGNVQLATEIPYTASNLNPQTLYYVYVQADCETSVSNWASETFRTTMIPQAPVALPYKPDFVTDDGWGLTNNGATNQWFIGSTTGGDNAVNNGLYVSDNNGTSNSYAVDKETSVYACRELQIDQTGSLIVSYDWRNAGEQRYDYLRVFLAPTTAILEANNNNGITPTATPDGWISLTPYIDETTGSQLCDNADEYTHVEMTVDIEQAGNMYLVFYWVNDVSFGTMPAASVINLWARMKVALSVESSSVHNGDTGVPVDKPITITLNDQVNINGEPDFSLITLTRGTETVDVTVTFENETVTITPAANLESTTEYTLTIPAGTIAGIDTEIKYTFTTGTGTEIGNVRTSEVRIYPAISQGTVTVEAPTGSTLKIASIDGRILNSYIIVSASQPINLNYTAGTYLLIVENGNVRKVEKIILK